jgi:hypothetical protein
MPTRTDVVLSLLDGTEHGYSTTTFMCTADRVAFERQFPPHTSGELVNLRDAFDSKGAPLPGADVSGLHEEWTTFFVWRTAVRGVPAMAKVSFEAFCDQAAEIAMTEDEEAQDPTPALRSAG